MNKKKVNFENLCREKGTKNNNSLYIIECLEIESNLEIKNSMEKLLLSVIVGTGHAFWKLN